MDYFVSYDQFMFYFSSCFIGLALGTALGIFFSNRNR
ncbi:hypothetical protein ALP86_200131 [Pseudomonas amygdali pv. mori]|uniref:Uncharacterized protein n=1 Tax=Pseudomonas amygdali pv. mori TaxID=34065 RepID=A0A3M4KS26_PSEA0|nr:hypothetical protein ALQ05_200038 [Pseudomonas amygdali pv. mori]RMR47797.1 hypothetical protein ALP86_200131 [Pseudomonas amygdali pv. mori]